MFPRSEAGRAVTYWVFSYYPKPLRLPVVFIYKGSGVEMVEHSRNILSTRCRGHKPPPATPLGGGVPGAAGAGVALESRDTNSRQTSVS